MTFTIEPLHIPASVDAPDAGDWNAYVEIVNGSFGHDAGTRLADGDATVWLVNARNQTYRATHLFVARDGSGDIVGIGNMNYSRDTTADIDLLVAVLPEHRGRGLEDAMFAHLEREALALGRTNAQTLTAHTSDVRGLSGDAVLRPSSGFGGVPRDDAWTRTLAARGYALGQVERASTFDLTGDLRRSRAMLEAATAFAGPEYEAVWWQGPTPDEHIDGYAAAITRMSTDVPSGDLNWEPTVWDAARVRDRERRVAESGQLWGVTIVVHRPTGAVAAFNELVAPPDRTMATENYGTLVVPEHRGRRLGTIVKCVGLMRWREAVPESPCVITWNAEENRHMLDVNEAVGFEPLFWEGAWAKPLT